MGFFNDAFQAIKGGIEGAVKTVVDPKNILNAVTGNLGAVGQTALANIIGGARPSSGGSGSQWWNVSQPLGSAKHDTRYPISASNHGMTAQEIEDLTQVFVKSGMTMSQAQTARNNWLNDYGKGIFTALPAPVAPSGSAPSGSTTSAMVKKSGSLSTGVPILDAAIGGALSGAGTHIGGTDVANNASQAVGASAFNQWLKTNWWKLALGIAAVGTAIFFMIRKPKKGGWGK